MKKYIVYLGILALGILLGSMLFGGSADTESEVNHSEIVQHEKLMWTCSMHPQIVQPEKGDCPICGMDLIPADSSEDGLSANEFKMTENAMALGNIETTVVTVSSNSSSKINLSGKIMVNEESEAVQTTHFGGRIEKLFINTTGEKVHKGQQLAIIYSPELVTAQKELLTALEMKDSDDEIYKAVRNKLKLWKLSEKQIQKIETSESIIEKFPIYSNVSGVVTMKMVEEGNYVTKGQGLFMIADLSSVWADFDAYESQLSSIAVGDEISLTTNADPNVEIISKITFINPVLDSQTRTVIIRTELNNEDARLKPGMFVQGVISPEREVEDNDVLFVPKSAVMWTGKRSLVYLKKKGEEPIFEMKEITLGKEAGVLYEVLKGLEENDEVVTNGTFTVDAAAQLKGKRSMMNRGGGDTKKGNEVELPQGTQKIERIKVAAEFQNQLRAVYKDYIEMKDALVNDDVKLAFDKIEDFRNVLATVDRNLLKDKKVHQDWMGFNQEMELALSKMAEGNEIGELRHFFMALSDNLTFSIQKFGINEKVYRQYCPMANNDSGAYWLSKEEQILNPYFGESMLKCGIVDQIIE